MAVSTDNAFSGPYLTNGVTTVFPFTFTAPSADEVDVVLRNASGVDTVATGFTTTLLPGGVGGSVAFAAPPAPGFQLFVLLEPEFTQNIAFENGSAWRAEPVNEGYDRSALRDQALKRDVDRGLKAPVGESGFTLPDAQNRAEKALFFAPDGTPDTISVDDFAEPARAAAIDAANFATILQNFVMGMWYPTPEAGVDPVTGVPPGRSYQVLSAGRLSGYTNNNGVPLGPLYTFATMAEFARFFGDRPVNPCDAPYYAAGDGVTDDNAAFLAALESGRIVDGGGRTFAIRDVLRPSSFAGLRNCKLRWLDPAAHPTGALLNIVGISVFDIDSVEIDIGDVTNTGAAGDSDRNGLRIWSSNPGVTTVEGFRVSRVSVTGNGHGSRIQIRGAKRFHVDDCYVHDCIASYTTDPTNDIMNGFDFKYCTNFTFSNNRVDRLLSVQSGAPTNIHTRGYLVAECQDFLDVNNCATSVGQGCDYSGAITPTDPIGVRGFNKIGGVYADCGYFGIKFANVARDGRISDVSVIRPGMIGVVASGSNVTLTGASEQLNTQNLDFFNCKVIDPLGRTGYASQGFRVMSNSNSPTWPRGVRFHNCVASDTQASPKMVFGFQNDVTYDGASKKINEAIGCISRGQTGDAMQGMQSWTCRLTGNNTQAIASSTATPLNWNVEQADSVGMHSQTTNIETITIPIAGRWRFTFIVNFAAQANGFREAQLRRNGVAINGGRFTEAAVAGAPTVIRGELEVTCVAGDTFRVEAYQDSGSSATVQLSNSFFYVSLLEES